LNIEQKQSNERIVVLSECLKWAKGLLCPCSLGPLLTMEALLNIGSLTKEEQFNGEQAQETVYLCYSSVKCFLLNSVV
jgi:hypothetical protein